MTLKTYKKYKYLRSCCAEQEENEKLLFKGLKYKFKFDQNKNFETYVSAKDYKKAKLIMLIDFDIEYGTKIEKKIAQQMQRYFL